MCCFIQIYESEKSDVTYFDDPGVSKLGSIIVPVTDTAGDKNRVNNNLSKSLYVLAVQRLS